MAIQEGLSTGVRETPREKLNIIDTDIHERVMLHDLAPRLPNPFQRYIKESGWVLERHMPYTQPTAGGLDRLDSKLPDGRPGGADIEWVKRQVLDECEVEYGILTGWLYPSMMRAWFEFATALATAVNDYQMENWLAKDDRLYGSIHIAAQDVPSAVREIERCADHPKMVQVMLPIEIHEWGDPKYHPIYEACQRHGLAVGFHHTENTPTCMGIQGFPRYFITWHSLVPQMFMAQVASLIFNGVPDKFPDLKIIMVEGGFTYVPHLIWKFDQQYKMLRHEVPWVKRLPSRILREQFRFATQPIEELTTKEFLQIVDQMGSDEMICFSTDYPHWDFDSPFQALPPGLPEDLRRKIFSENARAIYPKLPRKK